jgi:hypothetical protein
MPGTLLSCSICYHSFIACLYRFASVGRRRYGAFCTTHGSLISAGSIVRAGGEMPNHTLFRLRRGQLPRYRHSEWHLAERRRTAKINILAAGYQRASRKSAGRPSPPTKRTFGPGSWQNRRTRCRRSPMSPLCYSGDYCLRLGHGGPDTKIEHLVSITHLSFHRRVPLSREIEAYEKAQTANKPVATSSLWMPNVGTAPLRSSQSL